MKLKMTCSVKGCRKKVDEDGLCQSHKKEAQNPADAVRKVTDLEATRFSALDAEIRNNLQGVRILDLEMAAADRAFQDAAANHQAEQAARREHRKQLEALAGTKKTEYVAFVEALAEHYGLDPKQMVIDPEARTLRDLRGSGDSK